jgi:hypothetical protein
MEQGEPALDALQHRLSRLITAPSGVEAALADERDPEGRELAALVVGGAATPALRLGVYANAYFARLHGCLRDDFGATASALGTDAFHDLVKTYLMMHPPTRPSLHHAGAHLAEHLVTPPFAEIFARRCPYAADLARLEWAIAEAFTARDSRELAREELVAVPPDAWSDLRFETSASLRLLDCAWPVHAVRERFESELDGAAWSEPPALAAEPTPIRVWRRGDQVRHVRISALELEALAGVRAGEPFSALCERVGEGVGDADAAARAAGFLAAWIADGVLASLRRAG